MKNCVNRVYRYVSQFLQLSGLRTPCRQKQSSSNLTWWPYRSMLDEWVVWLYMRLKCCPFIPGWMNGAEYYLCSIHLSQFNPTPIHNMLHRDEWVLNNILVLSIQPQSSPFSQAWLNGKISFIRHALYTMMCKSSQSQVQVKSKSSPSPHGFASSRVKSKSALLKKLTKSSQVQVHFLKNLIKSSQVQVHHILEYSSQVHFR